MKIIDCEQYSHEWWQARRGVPTASNFDRILTPKTGKLSAQALDYVAELIGDRFDLLYPRLDGPISASMRHGTETEAEARRWFEMETGQDVWQVGFCLSDDERFGCSPDGLLGVDPAEGGLELKCPQPKTQVKYLLNGELPDDYKAQVHGSMIVTGRPLWYFVSYCPGLGPLKIVVARNDYTAKLAAALDEFHSLYQATLERVIPQSATTP